MHVRDIRITRPDSKRPRVRLQARIFYDRHSNDESYWLEVPDSMERQLNVTGSPWLAAMLPVCATFGERLRIDAPVDSTLLRGAREILRIWHGWDMGLHNAELEVETNSNDESTASSPSGDGRLSGAFFSAGVDSFFTVLQLLEAEKALDELIFIEGFDRRLHRVQALQRVGGKISQAAGALGLSTITVGTNLRQTPWSDTSFSFVAHGSIAAFVALALEPRFRWIYLASSVDSVEYDTDMPWGSHVEIDPLFSSSRMKLIHYGADIGRFDKVLKIAEHPAVQRNLCVCFQSRDGRNCGRCTKCLLTMAQLDMSGVYKLSNCFENYHGYLDRLRHLRVGDPGDIGQLCELRNAAAAAGRPTLAKAADEALAHSLRPWYRAKYRATRRLMLWAPHIRDRLRRMHVRPFVSDNGQSNREHFPRER